MSEIKYHSSGVEYYINLEDGKNWIQIKSDTLGEFEMYRKFKKA